MHKRSREIVAGSVMATTAAAALGLIGLHGGKDIVEGHAISAGSPAATSTHSPEHTSNFPTEMLYETSNLSLNIHDLYYRMPEAATSSPSKKGILHRVDLPLRKGVTTYFEQRSTIVSDPMTVDHIMVGQSDPSHDNQFKITFDKDSDDNWAVECIDNDNTLEISNGEISSNSGSVEDPDQAEQAMLAIARKSGEIVGAAMGDPESNPVYDPVPGICEQFMPR